VVPLSFQADAALDLPTQPDAPGQVDNALLNGLAKAGKKLVILLDIDRVLAAAETAQAVMAAAARN
jgi:chemotaxis signal transduction protein